MFWTVFWAIIAAFIAICLLLRLGAWWIERRDYYRETKQFVKIMSNPDWTTSENADFVRNAKLMLANRRARIFEWIAWGLVMCFFIGMAWVAR